MEMSRFLKRSISFIWYTTIVLAIYFVFVQIYDSLIRHKAFWLDEWFVLSSLKFRPISSYFSSLDYGIQFPRIYLSLINILVFLDIIRFIFKGKILFHALGMWKPCVISLI